MSQVEEESKLSVYASAPRALERRRPFLPIPEEKNEMETAPDLLAYWRVVRKRHWTIFTVLFVLFTVILIGTLKQKPVYRAGALLEIQKENPDIATVQGLFQLETVSDTYLETQYKVLQSESLARRVIRELGLEQVEEFKPRADWWPLRSNKNDPVAQGAPAGSTVAEPEETHPETLRQFQDRLSVSPVRRSRLVSVSFESTDPKLAARVVNTLASNYLLQTLEARWDATQKASEWLTLQLVGLKAKLENSEGELQTYARANGLLFLESQKGNPENIVNERLRQLQEELTRAQAARYEKESLYRLVQAGDYGALPGVFENKLLQDLTARLTELKREQADLLTTFSPDYPRAKQLQNQIGEVTSILERERERAAKRIVNDYQAAVRREDLVRRAFQEQQEQANQVAEKSVQYNILKREVETTKELYEGLLQKLKEAGVSAGMKANNIRILDAATPPRQPVKPRMLLNLTLAVVLGLSLGVGAAFLQEHLDNTLKTVDEVERFLRTPALALIPSVESLNGHKNGFFGLYKRGLALTNGKQGLATKEAHHWHRIDLMAAQHGGLAEAFRSLRTSVLLSTAERPPSSLLITSSQPAEGKSTIATNLAISLAQLGQRVLLVDGDLRRPSVHRILRISAGTGLVSYLTGQSEWQKMVVPSGLKGLDVLPCGPIPPNPVELLSSERMRLLILQAGAEYRYVIVDSPPLLNVADARILATLVEGTLLVARGGTTPREYVWRALLSAREVGTNVIGVVLNNVNIRSHDYYYYSSYGKYYQQESNESEGNGRRGVLHG